jgi:hypothetical protein
MFSLMLPQNGFDGIFMLQSFVRKEVRLFWCILELPH